MRWVPMTVANFASAWKAAELGLHRSSGLPPPARRRECCWWLSGRASPDRFGSEPLTCSLREREEAPPRDPVVGG